MPKRKSYTSDFKLTVITFAKEKGNRAAGREFSVDEKSIREWRKDEDNLASLHPRKRARRGRVAKWPNLEANLKQWILTQRQTNRSVSTVAIKLKARLMAAEMHITDFKGGVNWVFKFMKRNGLSVRARTTVGQRLPDEWETKLKDFKEFVKKEVDELRLNPDDIVNMDEVPMSFDIPACRTVEEVGKKTVGVTTTGHERTCFTVVLACTASGKKLKPMVIFKRVTMPREKLPKGIEVVCNKKGWMNEEVMKDWVDKCYRTRPGGLFSQKSLLIFDAMAAHKQSTVQKHINNTGAHIAVIPGGLTCKLQPLDIAVNHPFKCFVRNEWDRWMADGLHSFTPSGRQRRATYSEVCTWVQNAWKSVKCSSIINGFAKAGLVGLTLDQESSEEDNEDGDDDDGDESGDSDTASISSAHIQNVLSALFDDDYSSDFEGFGSSDEHGDDNEG